MPRLPKGMFARGKSYYTRIKSSGKRVWISLGPDYEEACRKLRALARESPTVRREVTVRDAAMRWLETDVKANRNERGLAQSRRRVEARLLPFIGSKLLHKVTRSDFSAYRLWLEGQYRRGERERGLVKPITVRHFLSDFRRLMRWSEETGWIDHSPVTRRVFPREPENAPDPLTEEERRCCEALPDPHGFVLRFMLGTGLRWGEMRRAQASDVTGGVLLVPKSKSGRVRRVPLPAMVREELRSRVGRLCRSRTPRPSRTS